MIAKIFINTLLASAALLMASSAHAVLITLDFESLSEPGTLLTLIATPILEDGFSVAESEGSGFFGPQESSSVRRDSMTVWTAYADNAVTVSKVGGGAFDLLSMDFGAIADGVGSATITGNLAGGGTVAKILNFNTDLPPAALETFSFTGFENLVSVTWSDTTGTQFDNIVLASVPEPTTLALVTLGIAGIGYSRKRKSA